MTTLLKLFSLNESVFEDLCHNKMDEMIEKFKSEFYEKKNSFPLELSDEIERLLNRHEDYLHSVTLKEKDNYVIMALKIGIELGRYFEILENNI